MPTARYHSPFAGTAPYYDRFRAPYAPEAIEFVVKRFGVDHRACVLDLGCGPGTIAIPVSKAAGEVIAVDPDLDMIAEGQASARSLGRDNIHWRRSRAEDIGLSPSSVRVATIGQAFHWMSRDIVLRKLGSAIADGGGLALLNPGKRRPQETWEPTAQRIVSQYLGPPTRHPQANPLEPEHEPALRRSDRFFEFASIEFPSVVRRDLRSVIGLIYSNSASPRHAFGGRAPAFERQLVHALLELEPSGVFSETIETEVLIAPKQPHGKTAPADRGQRKVDSGRAGD